jgi:hypothetical protein
MTRLRQPRISLNHMCCTAMCMQCAQRRAPWLHPVRMPSIANGAMCRKQVLLQCPSIACGCVACCCRCTPQGLGANIAMRQLPRPLPPLTILLPHAVM